MAGRAASAPATAPTRGAPTRRRSPSRRPAQPARRAAPAQPRGAVLLDRLVRGRAWVGFIGALLAGIVFLNVTVLELNGGIARTSREAGALARENARLRVQVARLGSTERIQAAAARRGFVMPAPGDVRYLTRRPREDALAAVRMMTEPRPLGATQPEPSSAATTSGTAAPMADAAPVAETAPEPETPPAIETAPVAETGPASPAPETP